jgi:hypothetical protein
MAVEQLTVCQWKNPYHLFQAFLEKKEGYSQSKTAGELVSTLKELFRGPTQIDKGRFSTIVQQDYLDFGDRGWVDKHPRHVKAMNKIIADKRKLEFDILSLDDRIALEQAIDYKCPDSGRQAGVRGHRALRGVWQLVHASALAEDIVGRREPHHIRIAILLVHGFLEDRCSSNSKPFIKAIIIGRTGIWKARAWIATKKLFITAEDYATNEDQFFVFQVPDFDSDPNAEKRFNSMRGVMAGTALDENYNGQYPIVAAVCGAGRLPAATRFFEANDRCIDASFINQLREQLHCGYFSPVMLIERANSTSAGAVNNDLEREYWQSLQISLRIILNQKEQVKSPLVIE